MEGLLRDVRLAVRGLRRSPGFTLAALTCLALAIGANTAVFSVVRGVLLRPLPYESPHRLVMLWGEMRSDGRREMPASGAELLDYRERLESFERTSALVNRYLNLTGDGEPERLVPGISLEQAQAEADALAARFAAEHPDVYPPGDGFGLRVVALLDQMVGGVRPALAALMVTVALVLLIACANVANLLLARATERRKELAIRSSVGARRRDLVRQPLVESMLLALAGAALGLLLAAGGLKVLRVG